MQMRRRTGELRTQAGNAPADRKGTARSSGREISSAVSISIDSHKRWLLCRSPCPELLTHRLSLVRLQSVTRKPTAPFPICIRDHCCRAKKIRPM